MSQGNTPFGFGATPPTSPMPHLQSAATQSSTRRWVKPLRFGVLGAAGCLLAALLGEGWLWLMRPVPPPTPPPIPPQAVSLVLDTSGSMDGQSLSDVKDAAKEYLNTQDLKRDRAAIVHFSASAEISAPLSHDRNTLEAAVDGLSAESTTGMDQGLQQGSTALQGATEARSILLFTDGMPDDSSATLQAANVVRNDGIQLVVVATQDADLSFLGQLTGDPGKVILAQPGAFTAAFQQAQKIISGYDLTASAPTQGDTRSRATVLFANAIWTALLGLGVTIALVWGQANYFHRRLFAPGFAKREGMGLLGGAGAGLASGAVAQLFFATAGSEGGRLIAWAMLGGILASGMVLFVPNLDSKRALLFGAGGGFVAALGYILLAHTGSDMVARLASALLLGFAIGLLVAFAEATFRRAWLKVEGLGNSEIRFDVNLGAEPIAVGADRARCLIYAPGAAPIEGRFALEGGQPYLQRGEAPREWLTSGDKREFGAVRVTLFQPRNELEGVTLPLAAPYATGAPSLPGTYGATHPSPPLSAPPAPAPFGTTHPMPGAPTYGAPTPPFAPVTATKWRLENPAQSAELNVGQSLRIGRMTDNEVVLGESSVSSYHARFNCDANGLFMTDLNSTNGTWINDVRLPPETPHVLHDGDHVRLGAFVWQVRGLS